MWPPERVIGELRRRGELWESAPGLVGLRGDTLALYSAIERAITTFATAETADEWRVPAGISFATLARADYFASFPQWLTAAAHLSDDDAVLAHVAGAADPAAAARAAVAPPDAALAPAVCYHGYAAFAGSTIAASRLMTAQATCWRHEGDRLAPLERGWAFTMREIVCLGSADEVEAFRRRLMHGVEALAAALGLDGEIVEASDPFFAPTAKGKALLQRVKALKHELVAGSAPDRRWAIASFNHHETFFGEAFGIRLGDGRPAATGCVAFGIERWLLAFLAAHGPDAGSWPAFDTLRSLHAEV